MKLFNITIELWNEEEDAFEHATFVSKQNSMNEVLAEGEDLIKRFTQPAEIIKIEFIGND